MATESTLTAALRARGEAAEDFVDGAAMRIEATLAQPQPRPHRTRLVLTVAAAVLVTLLVLAGVMIGTGGPSPTPNNSAVPANRPGVGSTQAVGSAVAGSVVNVLQLGVDKPVDYDLRSDAEYLTVEFSDSVHAQVAAFAPSIGFGAARMAGASGVTVDGRPGLYGRVSVWPANGRPDPGTGKQNGAVASVAWTLPNGTWVVVQGDDPFASASALVALANTVHVTAATDGTRLPYTATALPAQSTVTGVELLATGHRVSNASATLTSPSGVVTIELTDGSPSFAGDIATQSRTVGTEVLTVASATLPPPLLRQILAATTTVSDPVVMSASWPLLADALRTSTPSAPTSSGALSLGHTTLGTEIQLRSLRSLPSPCGATPPAPGTRPDPTLAVTAPDAAGTTCYALTPAMAVIDEVTSIATVQPPATGSPWTLFVGLMPTQQAAVATYTSAHNQTGQSSAPPADYLVILIDGHVVSASIIESAIIGGAIQFAVEGGQPAAAALFRTLTGR